jgi:fluoride ion exporter CrcB/FEX
MPTALAPTLLPAIAAVSTGAALGALLRWALGLGLNQAFPALPPGTLLANLVGGYLIGLAMALFAQMPALSPEWRLFVITGFLGRCHGGHPRVGFAGHDPGWLGHGGFV